MNADISAKTTNSPLPFVLAALIFILMGMVLASLACNRTEAAATQVAVPVRVTRIEEQAAIRGLRFTATIVPTAEVSLSFKSGGLVERILQVRGPDGKLRSVEPGDWVAKGTVLAEVRQDEYRNSLERAKQQLARTQADRDDAKLNFDRATALYVTQSITKTDYDHSKALFDATSAAVLSAQAEAANAEISLRDCFIRAPMDSWVLQRTVEVGSLVGPATLGFTLADTRLVKAIFGVPDTTLDRVRPGSSQLVRTDAIPGEFKGRITAVSASADPTSRVYSVEVTLPNSRNQLRAGMIASLVLEDGQKRPALAPLVPLNAIVHPPGSGAAYSVFVISGNGVGARVQLRSVELGQMYGNQVVVISGARAGEQVVTTGASMLHENQAVQVVP